MKLAIRLALIVASVAVLSSFTVHTGSEDGSSGEHPPHVEPAAAPVSVGTQPDWLSAAGVAVDQALQEIENARLETERLAEEERARDLRRSVPRTATGIATAAPDCAGIPAWFPHAIAWRESNCTRGINTGNGYYGYAQVARFHWFGGICDGLTWTEPSSEDECVWRLSAGGTNLRPWGG